MSIVEFMWDVISSYYRQTIKNCIGREAESTVNCVVVTAHTAEQFGIYSSVTTKEKKKEYSNTAVEKEVCGPACAVCTETL